MKERTAKLALSVLLSAVWVTAVWLVGSPSSGTQQARAQAGQNCAGVASGIADDCYEAPPAPTIPEHGWQVTFSEEFNGSSYDTNNFTPCFDWNYGACTATFNQGREKYLPEQVIVSNGTAKLRAEPQNPPISDPACINDSCDYRSGLLSTARPKVNDGSGYRFPFTYGYIETRMKFPAQQGFFSAVWMLPTNTSYSYDTEIDIVEILGDDPSTIFMTYHYNNRTQAHHVNNGKGNNGACDVKDYSTDFHTYGLDWQVGHIGWYIDGVKCGQFDGSQRTIEDGDMQLIIDLMVDHQWQRNWGVLLQDSTATAEMELDYVRIFEQMPGVGSHTPAPTEPEPTQPEPETPAEPAPVTNSNYESNLSLIRSASGTRNDDRLNSPYRDTPSASLNIDALTEQAGSNLNLDDGIGAFRTYCYFSHLAYDDPIVFPNQPGASHLHMFFGNDEINAYTNEDTLLNQGSSTCHGRELNRTGYWTPAVFDQDGNVQIPDRMVVYYKSFGSNVGQTTTFPKDTSLRIIGGNASTTTDQDIYNVAKWTCGGRNSGPYFATIPNCNGGGMAANIKMGQCWNGKSGWESDMSHVVRSAGHYYSGSCPSSHPIVLPSIEIFLEYGSTSGDTSKWFLASDIGSDGSQRPAGQTLHSDWWDGWNEDVNQTWIDSCVNRAVTCGIISHLGNGRSLVDYTTASELQASGRPDYTGVKTITPQQITQLCPGDDYARPTDSALCSSGNSEHDNGSPHTPPPAVTECDSSAPHILNVNFPQSDQYRVWLRGRSASNVTDPVYLESGTECTSLTPQSTTDDGWTWYASSAEVSFTNGSQQVSVVNQFDQSFDVDKLLFTIDQECAATADGTNCAPENIAISLTGLSPRDVVDSALEIEASTSGTDTPAITYFIDDNEIGTRQTAPFCLSADCSPYSVENLTQGEHVLRAVLDGGYRSVEVSIPFTVLEAGGAAPATPDTPTDLIETPVEPGEDTPEQLPTVEAPVGEEPPERLVELPPVENPVPSAPSSPKGEDIPQEPSPIDEPTETLIIGSDDDEIEGNVEITLPSAPNDNVVDVEISIDGEEIDTDSSGTATIDTDDFDQGDHDVSGVTKYKDGSSEEVTSNVEFKQSGGGSVINKITRNAAPISLAISIIGLCTYAAIKITRRLLATQQMGNLSTPQIFTPAMLNPETGYGRVLLSIGMLIVVSSFVSAFVGGGGSTGGTTFIIEVEDYSTRVHSAADGFITLEAEEMIQVDDSDVNLITGARIDENGKEVKVTPSSRTEIAHAPRSLDSPAVYQFNENTKPEDVDATELTCEGQALLIDFANTNAVVEYEGTSPYPYPVVVRNAKNVRLVGLDIELATQVGCEPGALPNTLNDSFTVDDQFSNLHPRVPLSSAVHVDASGEIFIEGANIDAAGHQADCVSVANSKSSNIERVAIQQSLCRGVEGHGPSSIGTGVSGGLIRTTSQTIKTLVVDGVEVRSSHQGIVAKVGSANISNFFYTSDDRYYGNDILDSLNQSVAIILDAESSIFNEIYSVHPLSSEMHDYDYVLLSDDGTRLGAKSSNGVRAHGAIHNEAPSRAVLSAERIGIRYVSPFSY